MELVRALRLLVTLGCSVFWELRKGRKALIPIKIQSFNAALAGERRSR